MPHTRIVQFFSDAVNYVSENIRSYSRQPEIDFTRNKKLPITTLLPFLVTQGSSSTKNELTEAYDFSALRPSSQAFIQQRAKLKPEGLQALFQKFNTSLDEFHPKGKYRFIAADGSSFTYSSSPKYSPDEFFSIQGDSSKGCYSVHLVATYDLDTTFYTEGLIQPIHRKDEFGAFCTIVDRHPLPNDGSSIVFLADRGFCSYNNMAHVIHRGQFFLFRAKDVLSRGILHNLDLPDSDSFDTSVKLVLVRKLSNKLILPDGCRRFIGKDQTFDYLEYGSSDFYELAFRVVRFKLPSGTFESLVTNLPEDEFSTEALEQLYHRRWNIETSFRDLKYTIGLTKFHASKPDFIYQEIWARLISYNFTEAVMRFAVVSQKKGNKYVYKVNFSAAVFDCRNYLRLALSGRSFDLIELLLRELIPIRENRSFSRLQTAHFRRPAYFIYRPS